jgi:hypothetical protein
MEERGAITMIRPEKYYSKLDIPDRKTQNKMWNEIQKGIHPAKRTHFMIPDRRSFLYGIAASILIYLSSVGIYHLISDFIERSQPPVVRIDNAYSSAIMEFERVIPIATPAVTQSQQSLGRKKIWEEQLRLLDNAIKELRIEINHNDLSLLKQARLRSLYSMKLQIFQKMIEQGDIEL